MLKFENRFYETDKMIKEYVYSVLCRKLILWNVILILASVVLGIFSYINFTEFSLAAATFAFCVGVAEIFAVPILTFKSIKNSNERIHNGKTFETIVRFNDNIEMVEGKFSIAIDFSQIIKVYELKYSFVLMFGKKNAIILSPEGFKDITYEEFKTYINKVCINIK